MRCKLFHIFLCVFNFALLFSILAQAKTSPSTDENGILYDILIAGAAGGIIAGGYSLKNFITRKLNKTDDKISAESSQFVSNNKKLTVSQIRIQKQLEKEKPTQNNNISMKEKHYYFENQNEFLIYSSINNDDSEIVWVSNDKYLELYNEGFAQFENNQFSAAIKKYKQCLEINPIGISARFELAECYIATKQYALAKEILFSMRDYFYENCHTARFYRRLGFILVEEKLYEIAYACFHRSLKFENHNIAKNEMQYLRMKHQIDVSNTYAESILDSYLDNRTVTKHISNQKYNKKKIIIIVVAIIALIVAAVGGGFGIQHYVEKRERYQVVEDAMISEAQLMIQNADNYLNMLKGYNETKTYHTNRTEAFLQSYNRIIDPVGYPKEMYQYVLVLSTAINNDDLDDILEARNDLAEHIDY